MAKAGSVKTGRKTRKVTFVCDLTPLDSEVFLVGDFNGWDPAATPMKRQVDGSYRCQVGLRPGRYEYKFLVDGIWMTDPRASEQVFNSYGTLNSVIRVE